MDISLIEHFKTKVKEICVKVYDGTCNPTIEEECKQKLIEPLLEELGYDTRGRDVYYEHGGNSRVDLFITSLACLEVKKLLLEKNGYVYEYVLGDPDHKRQLHTYLINHKYPFGILSNGIKWEFYHRNDYVTHYAWVPFKTIDLKHLTDQDIEFMLSLHKKSFSIENFNNFYNKYSEL